MSAIIEESLRKMTLEEKVSMCAGADWWHTRAISLHGCR